MLNTLRRIVQEVNEANDLSEAMTIMVARVADAIGTEACSVYLVDHRAQGYRMAASVGFREEVTPGSLILKFNEGLVGLAAEREEPINIDDASEHPRFSYFPETGEERYEAFLGVPIIHQRKVLGVLVVQQQERRRFDEGEEAFLITVSAQLSGVIAHAQAAGLLRTITGEAEAYDAELTAIGLPASPGVAVGSAVSTYVLEDLDAVPDRQTDDPKAELKRFHAAMEAAKQEMENLRERFAVQLPAEEQELFDVYLHILNSSSITKEIERRILGGYWAPSAVRKVIKHHVFLFEGMEDVYLRERATDLKDLGRRILSHLRNETRATIDYPEKTILVGQELTAAALAEVPEGKLAGIVSAQGSSNAHVAILARAMGIPAAMGVTGLPVGEVDGRTLIVDGYTGEVHLAPSRNLCAEYRRLAEEERELYAGLDELKKLPALTPDGQQVPLCVNTGLVADISPSLKAGAQGVGLYRTEVPFMIRDRFPGEEEQYLIYRQLLEAFHPDPVVVRTLDVGGDKPLPYFPIKEQNPSLGWRGIRVTLDHPEIFLVQLRAILRASAGLNNLKILLPMITGLSEIEEAMRLLKQAHQEVVDEGAKVVFPPIGAMIEVPAAVYQAAAIARQVDFLSVGSNDLTQYLLAADRNNPHVAPLFDGLHPAVIQALAQTVASAKQEGKSVSICGELAGDPAAAILLLGLGFDMLSMSAANLPRIKWVIRNFTYERAKELLQKALTMDSAETIRTMLQAELEQAGLGGLVRAGK